MMQVAVSIKDYDHHVGNPFRSPRPHGKIVREVGYCLRLVIPFGYADAVWRLRVYGWVDENDQVDDRGWFATINSTKLGDSYDSPQSAALAIRRALGQLGRSIETCIRANQLVPAA